MKTGQFQEQRIEQRQEQTASVAQVMLANIIEMPIAAYEQRVQSEVDANAALEVVMQDTDDEREYAGINDELDVAESHTEDIGIDEYATIDEVPEDRRDEWNQRIQGASVYNDDGEYRERQIADTGQTSYDELMSQIGEHDLTETEQSIMGYLVGSLDERGYLSKDTATLCDELLFQEYIEVSPEQMERLIHLLQSFEPRGIGARDLRECLLLQMECPPSERPRLSLVERLAHKVVRDMFDDLSLAHWKHIQDTFDVDDETIDEIRRYISHLNPRPGLGLGESITATAPTIIPDFRLYNDGNGNLSVVQNRGGVPELRISPSFDQIISDYRTASQRAQAEGRTLTMSKAQKADFLYASQKVNDARAFIDSMRRRRETLQLIMENIARKQRDFFVNDDDEMQLHPLMLRDVAEAVHVDISTVSRAVNSKYVQTDYGVYPLKHFFGSEFTLTDGQAISQRHALLALKSLIESEDPHEPLSDQALTEQMAAQGIPLARRTVAKYRERLGFPIARLRRR